MKKSGLMLLALFTAAALGGALGACDDASSDEGGGGGSNGGGGSGSDDFCAPAGQECTGVDAYVSCIETACGSTYEQCLGAGYRTGDFAGSPCADYMACASPCGCDTACTQACTMAQACMDCFTGPLSTCVQGSGCAYPVCTPTGGGTGGCAGLEACCGTLTGQEQTDCETNRGQLGGIDQACDVSLDTYRSAGLCP